MSVNSFYVKLSLDETVEMLDRGIIDGSITGEDADILQDFII